MILPLKIIKKLSLLKSSNLASLSNTSLKIINSLMINVQFLLLHRTILNFKNSDVLTL